MDVAEYISELLEHGYWVFPIKGKGKTIAEAKRPVGEWKNEEILQLAREYAERGHRAWAIWLKKSGLFLIDLDLYKGDLKDWQISELKNRLALSGFYVEKSARGGIHVIVAADPDRDWRMLSSAGWIEWKYDGYSIIYPTVLYAENREWRYEKLGGDLRWPGDLESFNDLFNRILKALDIDAEVELISSINNKGRWRGENVRIEGLGLPFDDLSNEQISALLYLLFDEAGCAGMARLLEWIAEHGVAPIKKEMFSLMRIPRTTRWLTQYVLASVLAYLGASEQRTYEWLTSWRFIDEGVDPRGDSLENALYNVYRRRDLFILPRGACPFCYLLTKNDGCTETPLVKIARIPRQKITNLIEFVKRHIKT